MDRAFGFCVLMVDVIFVIERDYSSHKQWINVNNSFDLVSMICYVIAFLITIYTDFQKSKRFSVEMKKQKQNETIKTF